MADFKSFLKESTWEYVIPKSDPEQVIIDFYSMSLLVFADPQQTLLPGVNSHIEDNIKTIKDEFLTLEDYLKKDLLDALYTCMASEIRHVKDANTSEKVLEFTRKHNIEEKIKKFFRGFVKSKALNRLNADYLRDPKSKINDNSFQSYLLATKSAKDAGLSGRELADFGKDVFINLKWSSGYGGEPWAQACEAYIQLENAKTLRHLSVAIDHILDLEHNNGTLLNKNKRYQKDGNFRWIKKILDFKRDAHPHDLMERSSIPQSVYAPILRVMNLNKPDIKIDKQDDSILNSILPTLENLSYKEKYIHAAHILTAQANLTKMQIGSALDWHIHENGGGLVHKNAKVDSTVFLGSDVIILGAEIRDNVKISGKVLVIGGVFIKNNVSINGPITDQTYSYIFGGKYNNPTIGIDGNSTISGKFFIKKTLSDSDSDKILILGNSKLSNIKIDGSRISILNNVHVIDSYIHDDVIITDNAIVKESQLINCRLSGKCSIHKLIVYDNLSKMKVSISGLASINNFYIDSLADVIIGGAVTIKDKKIIDTSENSPIIKIETQEDVNKLVNKLSVSDVSEPMSMEKEKIDTNIKINTDSNTEYGNNVTKNKKELLQVDFDYIKKLIYDVNLSGINPGDISDWLIHENGGGLVHKNTKIDSTVFLGHGVVIDSGVIISNEVKIRGRIFISGVVEITDNVVIHVGNSDASYIKNQANAHILISDNVAIQSHSNPLKFLGGIKIFDSAKIYSSTLIGINNSIYGNSVVAGTTIYNNVKISDNVVVRESLLNFVNLAGNVEINNSRILPPISSKVPVFLYDNIIMNETIITADNVTISGRFTINKKEIRTPISITTIDQVNKLKEVNSPDKIVRDSQKNIEPKKPYLKPPTGQNEFDYVKYVFDQLKISDLSIGDINDWHMHTNGNGLVHKDAEVDDTVELNEYVVVRSGKIKDNVKINGRILIDANVEIYNDVTISVGTGKTSYITTQFGSTDYITMQDKVSISGYIYINGQTRITDNVKLIDVRILGKNNLLSGNAEVIKSQLHGDVIIYLEAKTSDSNLKNCTITKNAKVFNSRLYRGIYSDDCIITNCSIDTPNYVYVANNSKLTSCTILSGLHDVRILCGFEIKNKNIDSTKKSISIESESDLNKEGISDLNTMNEGVSKITKCLLLDDVGSAKLVFERLLTEHIAHKIEEKKRFMVNSSFNSLDDK